MGVRWRSATARVASIMETEREVIGQGHDRMSSRRKVGII